MCGIGGIINKETSTFDKQSFEIIGVLNDSRGGDSCGIFVDRNVYKDSVKMKKFYDLTKFVDYPEEAHIALVHDRATSKQYTTNNFQCQPVIIEKDSNIEYVLMHNGTITNAEQLAKEYIPDVDIKDFSDSMIMAHIFYHKGYDVLSKYRGTAAFCIVDYREEQPKVLFWTSTSKYDSVIEDYKVERQLYYIKDDNRFIFSSLKEPLYLIDSTIEAKPFPTNQLLELKDNKLVVVQNVNRKFKKDKSEVTVSTAEFDFGDYDDNRLYNVCYDDELPFTNNRVAVNKITYNCHINSYFIGNDFAHGKFTVDEKGNIKKYTPKPKGNNFNVYMFEGLLIVNEKYFDVLCKYEQLLGSKNRVLDILSNIVDFVCYDPLFDTINGYSYRIDKNFQSKRLPGKEIFFSLFPSSMWSNVSHFLVPTNDVLYDILNVSRAKDIPMEKLNQKIISLLNNVE